MSDTQNDPKLMAFYLMLLANAKLNATCSRVLEQEGQIPIDVYDVLVTLEYEPERKLKLNELADKILLSKSGLTRRLDRMEKQGYIQRQGCPLDKRSTYAVLTDAGAAAREAAWPAYKETIRTFFGDRMTEAEAKQLGALMKRISDSLDRNRAQ